MYTRKQLNDTKMPSLKVLIQSLGGDPSLPQETKDSLIERILYQQALAPDGQKTEESEKLDAEIAPRPQVRTSIEDVIKALNPLILRGLKVYHNPDDDTWLFRLQIKSGQIRDTNTGETRMVERWRDDSGTLKQPLSTIKRCAAILMQNAPKASAAMEQKNPAEHYTLVS